MTEAMAINHGGQLLERPRVLATPPTRRTTRGLREPRDAPARTTCVPHSAEPRRCAAGDELLS